MLNYSASGVGTIADAARKSARATLVWIFGEQFFEGNAELSSEQSAIAFHVFGVASGVILPARLFFGIDDPAEWDAPGVILLALG
jgi:hypothetical protein